MCELKTHFRLKLKFCPSDLSKELLLFYVAGNNDCPQTQSTHQPEDHCRTNTLTHGLWINQYLGLHCSTTIHVFFWLFTFPTHLYIQVCSWFPPLNFSCPIRSLSERNQSEGWEKVHHQSAFPQVCLLTHNLLKTAGNVTIKQH